MPHFLIEHSSQVKPKKNTREIFIDLFKVLTDAADFNLAACKGRMIEFSQYQMADTYGEFIHLTLGIMPSRSIELKKLISNNLARSLKENFETNQNNGVAVTVEIREIEIESYTKL